MSRVTSLLLSLSIVALAVRTAPQPPNLSGRWELDSMMGGSPGALPHARSVCSGTSSPAAGQANTPDGSSDIQVSATGETFTASLTITQSAAAVTIARVFGGSGASGTFTGTYTLGGAEDVNVSGAVTGRTRSRWDGARFVIEGAVVAHRDGAEVTCAVTETFERGADGSLSVVEAGRVNGRQRTSRQTYFKAPTGVSGAHYFPAERMP